MQRRDDGPIDSSQNDSDRNDGGQIARQPVHMRSEHRGIKRRKPLTDERGNHARQHVARAARGHARIAGRVFSQPRAVGDNGPMALEQDHDLVLGRKLLCARDLLLTRQLRAGRRLVQAGKFARMRRQNSRTCRL